MSLVFIIAALVATGPEPKTVRRVGATGQVPPLLQKWHDSSAAGKYTVQSDQNLGQRL